MSIQPLVSIIVPVYNGERFLDACLQSVYAQSYANIEVLLVDDGSTDGSQAILNRYKKHYPRKTRVFINNHASGDVSFAVNSVFSFAQGVYVALMDADDLSCPDRVATQVAFLEQHRGVFLVGSCASVINEKGNKTGMIRVPETHKQIVHSFYRRNGIVNSSVMLRRQNTSLYFCAYPFFNDYYTWARYIQKGKRLYNIQTPLVQYRINTKSSSRTNLKRSYQMHFAIKRAIEQMDNIPVAKVDRLIARVQEWITILLPSWFTDLLIRIRMCF